MTLDEQDIVDNIPISDLLQNINARLFSLHEENRRLKGEKPKWHKVADGDLPKEDLRARTLGYYLTASKHKSYKGVVFEVAYFTGVIFTRGGDILDNVVAWCELPRFEEE